MKPIIEFFIDNAKFTLIIMAFLLIIGTMGLLKLKSESFPAVNFATATVETFYDGAGPSEVEEEVTKEIEDEIRTVSGLKDVRSTSQSGRSQITIRVDMDNVDVDEVMDDLQKAVQRVTDLPQGVRELPKYEEINSEEFPAMELAVVGTNENRKRDQFADHLKDLIEDSKKVKGVRFAGFREREYSVHLIKPKMDEQHIGISEVISVLRNRNKNIPAGNLERADEKLLVKLEGKTLQIADLENTVIRSNFTGQKILLKDIAIVKDGMEDPKILSSVNGKNAVLLTVTKKAGEDTIALVEELQLIFDQVKIPEGLEIVIYNNESEKVKNRLDVLSSNAFTGLALVIIFLFIFLPGKIGLVASMSLPIAVMATIGIMPYWGMNLNAITILALVIALGMLVDNSVVISENFTRLLKEGMSARDAAVKSAHQFWLPISCTAFTTIAAFLPMLVTKGVMGEFIKYIPVLVSLSLLLSLFESFFLLPTRLNFIAPKGNFKATKSLKDLNKRKKNDWFHGITLKFEGMMDRLVHRRYLVALGFATIIFGSLFMLIKVNKFILFPAEQTEIYIGRFETPRGTPVTLTREQGKKLTMAVKGKLKEDVEFIVARAGVVQTGPGDPKSKQGENVGMLTINMTREASFNLKYTEVLSELRKIKIPGLSKLSFEAQINGPPVGNPVTATFRSNNDQQLKALTDQMITFLKNTPGILNPEIDNIIGQDEVLINIDYEKLARLNLDVNRVGESLKAALEGQVITKINLDNKKFDLRVRLNDPDKELVQDLEKITIMDPKGHLVPLSTLATLKRRAGTPHIKHFDFQRAKTITADIDETKTTSMEANQKVLDRFQELKDQYPQVTLIFGGEQESTKESMDSLWEAMVLALIAIFGILVFLFKSYLRPLIIMSTIPLGLLGFSIAFYFHGRPVSFLSLIGVIGLAGIIVNSGIVLISFIDEMRETQNLSLHEILVKASGLRLRAVVVTSLTTISGLFPTAYGIGGSDLILIPMTLAMAWGLTSGTILTLVWIPCAYAILEDLISFYDKLLKKFTKTVEPYIPDSEKI